MGSFSVWHLLILLVIILLIFGGLGKIPRLMRDLGQGVAAFKKGLNHDSNSVEERTNVANTNKIENKDNINN